MDEHDTPDNRRRVALLLVRNRGMSLRKARSLVNNVSTQADAGWVEVLVNIPDTEVL